ncbi:MAG TPA: hypothetical protein VG963_08120, partial [Polyangiaceae bacterium]|nr:hypothetical protein [Polyangiaceae bacterium]
NLRERRRGLTALAVVRPAGDGPLWMGKGAASEVQAVLSFRWRRLWSELAAGFVPAMNATKMQRKES